MLIPNDENGAPVITYLQSKGIGAKTFPVTGQDAPLTACNVLTGYQCGTVYKPIYLEAQAAVALAVYLRAGLTPPAALVNGTTPDSTAQVRPVRPADPEWVTGQHGLDRHRRQVRATGSAVRRPVRGGLHDRRDLVAIIWLNPALPSWVSTPRRLARYRPRARMTPGPQTRAWLRPPTPASLPRLPDAHRVLGP